MKKFIYLLVICLGIQYSQAQTTVTKTRTSSGNKNDYLHKVANEFSEEVGNALKKQYPAKVSIIVKLDTVNHKLRLTYFAQIIKCNAKEAQYHFDHRGSLSARKELGGAFADAKSRADRQKTEALTKFKEAYGNADVVSQNSSKVKYDGYYWVIYETFLVSGK